MTIEEACALLDISPDEDLDLNLLEINYDKKIAGLEPASLDRERIDEACKYLLNIYDELSTSEQDTQKSNSFLNRTTFSIAAIITICLILFFALSKTNDVQYPVQHPVSTEMKYDALAEMVLPAVVQITTDKASGSGFFASNRGEILTNYHVIEGAKEIFVTLNKETFPINAVVKDFDEDGDMALLVIDSSKSTPFLRISKTFPKQGEAVMAVGNPFGFEGSISNGIISAFRQNKRWIQFTAPISHGSSGGALVNLKGEVVGMPTAGYKEGQNLNFAISPVVLQKFLTEASSKKVPRKLPEFDPIKLLHVSAEQGSPGSQCFLGDAYYTGAIEINDVLIPQDYKWAAYWYQKAAEQGHAEAQYKIADMYYLGEGVEQSYPKAMYWHQKAAKHGNARSQYITGLMYAKARGVQQDYQQARYWYLKAAEQEYANAQVNLGAMYHNGEGVKKDYQQAIYWYRKAAEQGNDLAQLYIGYMYEDGEGVKQSTEQAVYWYKLSAKQGNQTAKDILAEMGIYSYTGNATQGNNNEFVSSNFQANASITGDKVNIRTQPNTASKVVKQLNAGHPVRASKRTNAKDGTWYFIQTASGTEGWVFGKYVMLK